MPHRCLESHVFGKRCHEYLHYITTFETIHFHCEQTTIIRKVCTSSLYTMYTQHTICWCTCDKAVIATSMFGKSLVFHVLGRDVTTSIYTTTQTSRDHSSSLWSFVKCVPVPSIYHTQQTICWCTCDNFDFAFLYILPSCSHYSFHSQSCPLKVYIRQYSSPVRYLRISSPHKIRRN